MDLLMPFALAAAMGSLAVVGRPWGDFPINDDWSYAAAVSALVKGGKLAYTDWTSMPLLPQVLWGALFAELFGYSHNVLRVSTLVISGLGVALVYGAAREAGAKPARAALASVCLMLHPLYFSLSLSFMTDVVFVTLVTATFWAWLRHVRTGTFASYALGIGLAVAATLQRQVGVALPLAFAAALFASRGASRALAVRAAIPVVVVLGFHLAYDRYVTTVIGRPALYDLKVQGLIGVLRHPGLQWGLDMIARSVAIIGYLGPAFLPLALGQFRFSDAIARLSRGQRALAGGLLCALAVYVLAVVSPPFESLIHAGGVGLLSVQGDVGDAELFMWGWRVLVLSGVLAALLVCLSWLPEDFAFSSFGAFVRKPERVTWFLPCFVGVATLGLIGPVMPGYPFFDRYLLCILPLLGVLVASRASTGRRSNAVEAGAIVVLCASLAALCVVTTQDCFAWNRARWQAIAYATHELGSAPEWIDGGFEYNASREYVGRVGQEQPSEPEPVNAHRFLVAWSPPHGYGAVARFPTGSWLHSSRDILLVERGKRPPDAPSPDLGQVLSEGQTVRPAGHP